MRQAWGDFLKGAGARAHGVQVYGDAADLAESVASYLAAGFERNQPGVLVATPEHLSLFADRLGARGWRLEDAESAGLVVVADAEETLALILGPNGLERGRFEHVVGGLLDRVEHGPDDRPARVFGEMVDLLCRRDQAAAADELEQLWNLLAQQRRFSLLCGYRLDVFDVGAQAAALPHVCGLHSHVLPASNYARLASALDRALGDVLGSAGAGNVYRAVARERDDVRVPMAQLIMMWLSANRPVLADRVLDAAREHYRAQPAAA